MRGISRRVLARDATGRIEDAACAGLGWWWSALEQRHSRAADPVKAAQLVEEARAAACRDCPALLACAAWARAEEYTGLAAGAPYENGQRRPSDWAPRKRPGRKRARQPAAS